MLLVRRFDPEKHHRQSIRLQDYDYSKPGLYFLTICTHGREYLFGTIENGSMTLNSFGQIARDQWLKTPEIRPEIELGEFVVMPNHIHGIIIITNPGNPVGAYGNTPPNGNTPNDNFPGNPVGAYCHTPLPRSPSKTLGAMVRGYKSTVTTQINMLRNTPNCRVWQRNFYDHIIRDQASYEKISDYIRNNPAKWTDETFFL